MRHKGKLQALFLITLFFGCHDSTQDSSIKTVRISTHRDQLHLEVIHHDLQIPRRLLDNLDSVYSISINARSVNDRDLSQLAKFNRIKALYIGKSNISGTCACTIISSFRDLEILQLRNMNLDQQLINSLNVVKLRRLLLSNCNIASNDLNPLEHAINLVELDMSLNADVTDSGIESIGNATKLEKLYLQGTSVDGSFVSKLRHAPLRVLDLGATKIGDNQIRELQCFNLLQILDISENEMLTFSSLDSLKSLEELIDLNLSHTRIDDSGLVAVLRLPSLERLHLCSCDSITETGLLRAIASESASSIKYIDLSGLSFSPRTIAKIEKMGIEIEMESFATKVSEECGKLLEPTELSP